VLWFLDRKSFFSESGQMLIQRVRKYISPIVPSDKMIPMRSPGERCPSHLVS
jgi:hypothetical protein